MIFIAFALGIIVSLGYGIYTNAFDAVKLTVDGIIAGGLASGLFSGTKALGTTPEYEEIPDAEEMTDNLSDNKGDEG